MNNIFVKILLYYNMLFCNDVITVKTDSHFLLGCSCTTQWHMRRRGWTVLTSWRAWYKTSSNSPSSFLDSWSSHRTIRYCCWSLVRTNFFYKVFITLTIFLIECQHFWERPVNDLYSLHYINCFSDLLSEFLCASTQVH